MPDPEMLKRDGGYVIYMEPKGTIGAMCVDIFESQITIEIQ